MLYRAFLSFATATSIIVALGNTASAGVLGSTASQAQHHWVGATLDAAAVSSVSPSHGFSASERPSSVAGGVESQVPAAGGAPALIGQSPAYGAIVLSAHQHDGAQAIDVTGTAPPGTSVEITARARLSIDLPVVFLNRLTTVADASGAFAVTLPIAPDYITGTQILILAEAPGNTPGTASFVVGEPSVGPPVQATDVDSDHHL